MAGAGVPYCVVVPSFWSDPDVRGLDMRGRYLLLYFITSPHSNLIGLYYVPLRYVSVETGLDEVAVKDLVDTVLRPFLSYDENTQEVLIHNFARYQIGDMLKTTDNRVKTVNRLLRASHSGQLVSRFADLYRDWPLDVSAAPPAPAEQGEPPLPPDPVVPATEVSGSRRAKKEHIVEGFEQLKMEYPKRDGDHGWPKAEGHVGVWLKKGESFDDLMSATKRYKAYCIRTGREGTDKVKQAATFFGPNAPWKEYLPPPQLRVVTPVANAISIETRVLRSKLEAGLITQEEYEQATRGVDA